MVYSPAGGASLPDRRFVSRGLLVFLLLVATVAPSAVSAGVYMRFIGPGTPVPGDSTNSAYPAQNGWFYIDSVQYGISRPAGNIGGGGGAGVPQASELTVSLPFGRATTVLMAGVAQGRNFDEVEVILTRAIGSKEETYLKLEFAIASPTSVSLSSGGDAPYASLSVAFAAQRFTWTEFPNDGGPSTNTVSSYNFATNTATYPNP